MKSILITTAFLTAPMVSTVAAQSGDALKRQIAEQNRQILALENQVSSLQSQLNLERTRNGKAALPTKKTSTATTKYHVVKSGETFSGIARKNGVSLASLIAANKGVSPNKIAINQKLVIPQNTATANVTPTTAKPKTSTAKNTPKPTAKGTYTVQKGDTFYGIARKNNTTVSKLIAMNPKVKPSKIKPGQKLQLTGSSKTAVATNKAKAPAAKPVTSKPKPATQPAKPVATTPAKPVAKPAPKPVAQPIKHAEPTNVAKTVTVNSVMTYGQFAKKNGTTISVLNAMNGLDLPADEPMAVGSALYVPTK